MDATTAAATTPLSLGVVSLDFSTLLAVGRVVSWWTVRISFILGLCCLLPGLSWILYDFVLWTLRCIRSVVLGRYAPTAPSAAATVVGNGGGKTVPLMKLGENEGMRGDGAERGDSEAERVRRRAVDKEAGVDGVDGDAVLVTGRRV